MSERARNLAAFAVIATALTVIVAVLASAPPSAADRVSHLASRLKCPICTSESIADSPSDLSRQLTALIAERVDEGWSDEEIVAFFVATYGEEVLLDPPGDGRTAALWALPLAVAALGTVWILGRRRIRGTPEVTDADRERIARAMRDRE